MLDEEEDEDIEESLDSNSESEDAEDEGPTTEDEDPAAGQGSLLAGERGPRVGGVSDCRSDIQVGHSSGSCTRFLKDQRECRHLGSPHSLHVIDPEDGIAYIDVLAYPPPTPPAQTPSSLEWSSSSLPVSPTPSIVPLPISSPMIPVTIPSPVASLVTTKIEGSLTELGTRVEIHGGLIRDHTVRLEELSPALFERSLEHEQERVVVTFRAIWRPVLALESWTGQTDAQRATLWHAISDTQMENQDLGLQIAEERRARLDLAEIVDSMRRGQESRGDV
ncbi:hypothetical protein Tco_1025409 [Tanacetum coccineum]